MICVWLKIFRIHVCVCVDHHIELDVIYVVLVYGSENKCSKEEDYQYVKTGQIKTYLTRTGKTCIPANIVKDFYTATSAYIV